MRNVRIQKELSKEWWVEGGWQRSKMPSLRMTTGGPCARSTRTEYSTSVSYSTTGSDEVKQRSLVHGDIGVKADSVSDSTLFRAFTISSKVRVLCYVP